MSPPAEVACSPRTASTPGVGEDSRASATTSRSAGSPVRASADSAASCGARSDTARSSAPSPCPPGRLPGWPPPCPPDRPRSPTPPRKVATASAPLAVRSTGSAAPAPAHGPTVPSSASAAPPSAPRSAIRVGPAASRCSTFAEARLSPSRSAPKSDAPAVSDSAETAGGPPGAAPTRPSRRRPRTGGSLACGNSGFSAARSATAQRSAKS